MNVTEMYENMTNIVDEFERGNNNSQILTPNRPFDYNGSIRIPLYSIIFVLSIVGNGLVILTLAQNRRMRTVTNVFLLNLSISDLLLAVFCMPFTLIPQLMRAFIFGEFMCITIRYLQAVSVGVSCFTLVTISLERYFAIVEPLKSRRWQTKSHSYKCITAIWIITLVLMVPIAASHRLLSIRNGTAYACREIWSDNLQTLQIVYSIGLCLILFVIPLSVMAMAYGRIAYRLWIDITQQDRDYFDDDNGKNSKKNGDMEMSALRSDTQKNGDTPSHVSLRHSNMRSSVASRKRVIKMLFVIVLEYFVCWTPLYVCSTWKIVDYNSIHYRVSNLAWHLISLLAYVSSFVHPITYCFMNKNFRKGFLSVFKCFKKKRALNSTTEVTGTSSPNVRFHCADNTDYTRVQTYEH